MKQTLCPKRIKLPFLPPQHQFSTRKCRHRKDLPCQQQRASHRVEIIINVVARHRLPAVYPNRFYPTDGEEQQRAVADTLEWFGFGVTAAVIALALAYFTNYSAGQLAISRLPLDQHPYFRDGPATLSWRLRYWTFLWAESLSV